MATKKKPKEKTEEIIILRLTQNEATFCLRGSSPLVYNRLHGETRKDLLLPPKKVKGDARELTLKHDPYQEFLNSTHNSPDKKSPTLLVMPGIAFKKALMNATLDMESGPSKASIGRLVEVVDPWVPIYGTPMLWMTMIRQAGIGRTPDIRTRAILDDWAAIVTIRYTSPNLTEHKIGNLLANAGIIIAVGDGRQEKGSLSCGKWGLVSKSDGALTQIIKTCGRKHQMKEMIEPQFFDQETEELYTWFEEEAERREFKFTRMGKAS